MPRLIERPPFADVYPYASSFSRFQGVIRSLRNVSLLTSPFCPGLKGQVGSGHLSEP